MSNFVEKRDESPFEDGRLDGKSDLTLRLLSDVEIGPKKFVENIYFAGLNVMRCYGGRFRFTFSDRPSFVLSSGELVVIYPHRFVTIEGLDERNRIMYCIFDGADSERYFDDLGFFDCARGITQPRIGGFMELRRMVEDPANRNPKSRATALRYLTDMLDSQLRDLKSGERALLIEAAHMIHANLKRGLVRLDPLCDALKVSRSFLHKKFVEAGLPSPSAIIRNEQLRLAVRLLREERISIPEVMDRAGFVSQSHFSTFIKRLTGKTPGEIRRGA